MSDEFITPLVAWAQKKGRLIVTFEAEFLTPESVKDAFKVTEDGILFSGTNQKTGQKYHFEIEFYGKIIPSTLRYMHGDFRIVLEVDFVGREKWPSLTKGPKLPQVRIDFGNFEGSEEETADAAEDLDWTHWRDQTED